MLTVTAVYTGGVLKPTTRLDLPENTSVEIQIMPLPVADPKDALMEDGEALRAMYAEFAQEDRQLAQTGLAHYAQTLRREESPA
jgi:predicted DNA-binding antitoxin AbrB/MazE fold protein